MASDLEDMCKTTRYFSSCITVRICRRFVSLVRNPEDSIFRGKPLIKVPPPNNLTELFTHEDAQSTKLPKCGMTGGVPAYCYRFMNCLIAVAETKGVVKAFIAKEVKKQNGSLEIKLNRSMAFDREQFDKLLADLNMLPVVMEAAEQRCELALALMD